MGRTFLFLFALALALLSTFHQAQANKCFKRGKPTGFNYYGGPRRSVGGAGECREKCQEDPKCKYWLIEPLSQTSFGPISFGPISFGPQGYPVVGSSGSSGKKCRFSSNDYSNVPSITSGFDDYEHGHWNCNDCFGRGWIYDLQRTYYKTFWRNFDRGTSQTDPKICYEACKKDEKCKSWSATEYDETNRNNYYVACYLNANDYSNKRGRKDHEHARLFGSKNCSASSSDW